MQLLRKTLFDYNHSLLIYTVGSLQAKCIVKMSSIFLPVLRHKDFFGWVTSLHGEKKMFPISFSYIFFKKLWGFSFELIDFALEESAVGEQTVTFVLFQILEIGTKHARRCREPTMTS